MRPANERPPTETQVARQVQGLLADRIPPGWNLRARREAPVGRRRVDLLVEIESPGGETAVLAVEIKPAVQARDLLAVVRQISQIAGGLPGRAAPVVAGAYLSPRARSLLRDSGVGYVDTTGNIWIEASAPGLFISATGVDRDPWPREYKLKSLRGRGAARALRAIVDACPPYGVREVAQSSRASAPTLSRVLDLLEREAIVARQRGAVSTLDWQTAIRRWTQDYGQMESNTPTTALEPRGLSTFGDKLQAVKFAYAATGAFAAQRFDPVAPARRATVYVSDAAAVIDQLDLREVEAGANIVLLEPLDSVVFDRTVERGGLRCVAPSQLVADLLTGPGREPAQGEQLMQWMAGNESAWRS